MLGSRRVSRRLRQRRNGRTRYEELRVLFERRVQEARERLRALRGSAPGEVADVRDTEELSSLELEMDVDAFLLERQARDLAEIDAALRSLEHGGYGECIACDRPIDEARLAALPFARRCRNCQEREEARAAEEATTGHAA